MSKAIVVAIDGPVASGKDTVSSLVANKLSGIHLNSGAFFRAVAYLCIKENVPFTSTGKITSDILSLTIAYHNGKIIANGEDITDHLSKPEVAKGSSEIAIITQVQEASIVFARRVIVDLLASGKSVVIDGRNAATAIYPKADVKIMLLASLSARVKRRMSQYQQQNKTITERVIENDIISRDNRDMGRKIYPLVLNPLDHGYAIVDTSEQTVEESVSAILKIIETNL